MSHYRGYFMKEDRIVAPENIDATDDAQAMLKAGELLSTSEFARIEVWQETRVVGALSTPAPPDEAKRDTDDPYSAEDRGSNIVEFRKR